MMFDVLAMVVAGLGILFGSRAESAPCLPSTVTVNVTSTSDIQHLTEELNCTGPGKFDITWYSSLTLGRRIEISDMKDVTVTGYGFPTIRGELNVNNDNNDSGAIADHGNGTGMFSVSHGSTLHLIHLVLAGGKSEYGGVVDLFSSSTLFVYGCKFTDNNAIFGGAINSWSSEVHINGDSSFSYNSATDSGGAIYSGFSEVYIDGDSLFSHNSATDSGGAVYANSSVVYMDGSARLLNNRAGDGGAIYASSTQVYIGNLSGNEGGAYSEDTGRSTSQTVAFVENAALRFGGGLFLESSDALQVTGVVFESNSAEFGGAMHIAAAEYTESEFSACVFARNKATDGGAVYLITEATGAGVIVLTSSMFHGNFANDSGGAIMNIGALGVVDSIFEANTAGVEGPAVAVASVGLLDEFSNVSFVDNTKYCRTGKYGYVDKSETNYCRSCFDEVCSRCVNGYNGVLEDMIQIDGKPVCAEPPLGASASASGTTVATLVLNEGYFRTSNQSLNVLECYLPEACFGGADPTKYCAAGYTGPLCATCADGYTQDHDYHCNVCPARAYLSTVLLAGMLVFVVLSWGLLLLYLGRVANYDRGEEIVRPRGFRRRAVSRLLDVIDMGSPLSAITSTVVVWQIIAQFAVVSGNIYPHRYATFISIIRVVNVDFGYFFSLACILRFNFYHHLLLATIGPFVVILALGGTYALMKIRDNVSETGICLVRQRLVSVAVFVMVFVYASVTFTVFQTFSCDMLDDGNSYLRADYSISCSTSRHKMFSAYAFVMVGIYTLGIPGFFLWWLLRNRKDLKAENRERFPHLQPFSTIWIAYSPARYFYEVVECGRRVVYAVSAIVAGVNGRAQAVVVLLTTGLPLLLDALHPFNSGVDMALYRWGNVIVLGSVFVEFLSSTQGGMETHLIILGLSDVLIFANLVMVATVLGQGVLLAMKPHAADKVTMLDVPVRNLFLEVSGRRHSEHGRHSTRGGVR